MILGVIADDFTGSSDIANTLAKGGMRSILYAGIPHAAGTEADAGVIALKTRTIDSGEAVAAALASLDWLRRQGCRQFVYKYCSTFDSSDTGNIGPVAEAMASVLGARGVVVCPAFPGTGRTLYQGHLFVRDMLLSESGMENHPLTPMRDPDVRRVLARQSTRPPAHVPYETVREGPDSIRRALAVAGREATLVVVDAVSDADLFAIGQAVADAPLITGASGIALGLPGNFRRNGELGADATGWSGVEGPAAIIAGSTSSATRLQVAHHEAAGYPTFRLDVDRIVARTYDVRDLAAWALGTGSLPLITTTAEAADVGAAQARHGREEVVKAIETLFAHTARALVDAGTTRLVVAGGETSGAVVGGLDITAMEIGPEIDPGVPALKVQSRPLALALKSGNFGAADFFEKAARVLGGGS